MRHIAKLGTLLALTVLAACASNTNGPNRGVPLRVVVAIIDSDTTSHSVAERAVDSVARGISQTGHIVLSADAVFSNADLRGHNVSKAELVDLARSATRPGGNRRAKIDVLAAIKVTTTVKSLGYTNKVSTRVYGQLINVNSGRIMSSYELSDPYGAVSVHNNCNNTCLNEKVGDQVADIAETVGHELAASVRSYRTPHTSNRPAARLDSDFDKMEKPQSKTLAAPTDYVVELRGLDKPALKDLLYYMTDVFSGYNDHDVTGVAGSVYEFTYTSTLHPAKLERNLRRAAHELNWNVRVYVDGTQVSVVRQKDQTLEPKQKSTFNDW